MLSHACLPLNMFKRTNLLAFSQFVSMNQSRWVFLSEKQKDGEKNLPKYVLGGKTARPDARVGIGEACSPPSRRHGVNFPDASLVPPHRSNAVWGSHLLSQRRGVVRPGTHEVCSAQARTVHTHGHILTLFILFEDWEARSGLNNAAEGGPVHVPTRGAALIAEKGSQGDSNRGHAGWGSWHQAALTGHWVFPRLGDTGHSVRARLANRSVLQGLHAPGDRGKQRAHPLSPGHQWTSSLAHLSAPGLPCITCPDVVSCCGSLLPLKTCFPLSSATPSPWPSLVLAAPPHNLPGSSPWNSLPSPLLAGWPSLWKMPRGKQKEASSAPAGEPGGPRP